MECYFYHGFESYPPFEDDFEHAINIIKSGELKTRNELMNHSDINFDHVCLYKKNEDYNYDAPDAMLRSARGGWIDHCIVFIIDSDIEAYYFPPNLYGDKNLYTTDLVDEWRSVGSIPMSKVVGLALPLDNIFEYFSSDCDSEEELEEQRRAKELFSELLNLSNDLGFFIENSDEKNFTDKIDSNLCKSRQQK